MDRRKQIAEIRAALGMEWPSCVNCFHFFHGHPNIDFTQTTNEHCMLDPLKRRPPARVIANGCPAFEEDHDPLGLDDDVPF